MSGEKNRTARGFRIFAERDLADAMNGDALLNDAASIVEELANRRVVLTAKEHRCDICGAGAAENCRFHCLHRRAVEWSERKRKMEISRK